MDRCSQHDGKIMEVQTSFDLNNAIGKWRARLAAEEGMREDVLRELESHLRDGVEVWRGKGLSEEEAFWVAARRIGQAREISAEFAKAEPLNVWRTRLFWMLVGIISMNLLSDFTQIVVFAAQRIAQATQAEGTELAHWFQIARLVTPLALCVLALWILRGGADRWSSRLAWLAESRTRVGLAVVAMLIGAQWMQLGALALMNRAVHLHGSLLDFAGMLIYPVTLGFLIARTTPHQSPNRTDVSA